MNIREATLSDAPVLANLWVELAEEMEKHHHTNELKEDKEEVLERTTDNYKQLILNVEYEAYVAEVDGEPVGYIDMEHQHSDLMMMQNSILIRQLYVRPDYRNNGIGSALLDKTVEYSENNQIDYITIPVEWENTRAQELYKSKGFEEKQVRLVKTID